MVGSFSSWITKADFLVANQNVGKTLDRKQRIIIARILLNNWGWCHWTAKVYSQPQAQKRNTAPWPTLQPINKISSCTAIRFVNWLLRTVGLSEWRVNIDNQTVPPWWDYPDFSPNSSEEYPNIFGLHLFQPVVDFEISIQWAQK